jgi:hypothetical protein
MFVAFFEASCQWSSLINTVLLVFLWLVETPQFCWLMGKLFLVCCLQSWIYLIFKKDFVSILRIHWTRYRHRHCNRAKINLHVAHVPEDGSRHDSYFMCSPFNKRELCYPLELSILTCLISIKEIIYLCVRVYACFWFMIFVW